MLPSYSELDRLAHRLRERVPFVASPLKTLLVYGYIHTPDDEPDYADACSDLLRAWATTRGWEMSGVFRDLGVQSRQVRRPAFTALQDVLQVVKGVSVLLVHERHLSCDSEDGRRLTAAIRRAGSTVRVLTDELSGPQS